MTQEGNQAGLFPEDDLKRFSRPEGFRKNCAMMWPAWRVGEATGKRDTRAWHDAYGHDVVTIYRRVTVTSGAGGKSRRRTMVPIGFYCARCGRTYVYHGEEPPALTGLW